MNGIRIRGTATIAVTSVLDQALTQSPAEIPTKEVNQQVPKATGKEKVKSMKTELVAISKAH